MQQPTSTAVMSRRALAVVTLVATLMVLSSRPAQADSEESRQNSLVGAWSVQVTLRNCATGAPLGPPFNSLVTYHQGGTVSEAAGSLSFAPGQRSPGHGVWTREPEHTFGQSMLALILFDTPPNLPGTPEFDPSKPVSPGFFAGWQTVTHTVTPTSAEHITSAGTNAFYKLTGELYRTGCSTAVGQRFE
ncbi:MAG: hypothetical protein OEW19_04645 [Acidobacteriota bacterium]|nr:hypothetical protein [Acidobacteriota bacterium]